ncbi:hypothetical protein KPHES18084_08700 [Corynebacterium ulcerans]|nr:hypothetical protein CULTSU28_09760 [Corynebacterium ulcerans]
MVKTLTSMFSYFLSFLTVSIALKNSQVRFLNAGTLGWEETERGSPERELTGKGAATMLRKLVFLLFALKESHVD